jgi:hypothetical protein
LARNTIYCAHYYAIQAMVQAVGEKYSKWYPQIRDALISQLAPWAIIILATPIATSRFTKDDESL